MARPRKEIDSKQFEALCKIQCTQAEICDVLDVTDKTLTRWCRETYSLGFSDIYKKYASHGKAALRRAQFKLAEHNASMAIWLGKIILDQKETEIDKMAEEGKVTVIIDV